MGLHLGKAFTGQSVTVSHRDETLIQCDWCPYPKGNFQRGDLEHEEGAT